MDLRKRGELVATTDARGITVSRTVDALDRLTLVDYLDDALDTANTYDSAPRACTGTSFPMGAPQLHHPGRPSGGLLLRPIRPDHPGRRAHLHGTATATAPRSAILVG